MNAYLKEIKTIIWALLTYSSALQADEMDVFCYSESTDTWEWIIMESGDYLSFDGEKRRSHNVGLNEYFYYVSIDESLYARFVEYCPSGSVPQPAYTRFSNWNVFNVQQSDGESFFAAGKKSFYHSIDHVFLRFSDRRLKKNIHHISPPISSIKKIQGVKYEMIDSGETELGFIAQDLQQIYPEMVRQKTGSEYLMVDYRAMIPVLLEAIKELESRISDLEAH
ncbi:tail fiber domain-containing protein [Shewanella sp. VB17]|uniref:tail fiber domain-containing protein n=1 Tax=Shewanella sp. VB17 TaxID=2739432 RepID=UPI0015671A40|nr:tail fiber domain-containing protein [Shewanella sp. VB17]NRD75240.1 tail fiber domain-containing protein [Shewanella sp. VB17]